MKIELYTGYDKFYPRGTITIQYDRIVHLNIILPNGGASWDLHKFLAEYDAEKTGKPVNSFTIYDRETSFKIAFKRLSKADIPYRKERLTHQIMSTDFEKEIRKMHIYTKLKWWQVIRLNYSLKKYLWQTKDFKKHIFYYLATSGIGFIGGLVLGWGIWYKSIKPPELINTQSETDSQKTVNPVQYDTSSSLKGAKIQPDSAKETGDTLK